MRARLSGSTITAHGDNLGAPFVEFYGNEPLGFPAGWTVTGSSPNRVLVDPQGHAYSPELPTQTAPAAESGGSISATDGTTSIPVVTSLSVPAGTLSDLGDGVAGVGLIASLLTLPFAFDSVGVDHTGGSPTAFADGGYVQLGALPDGCLVTSAWVEVGTPFNGGNDKVGLNIQPSNDPDNSSTIGTDYSLTFVDTTAPSVFAAATLLKVGTADVAFGYPPRVIAGAALMVRGQFTAPPTEGSATVYALIATPAA